MLLVEDAHDTSPGLESVVARDDSAAHVGSWDNGLSLSYRLVVVVLSHAHLGVAEVQGDTVDLDEYLAILRRGKGALFHANVVQAILFGNPLLNLLGRHDCFGMNVCAGVVLRILLPKM
jgi:hypothetical protein